MAQRRINAVPSTSAGRLFDAASAICGICRHSTFEGEASMSLQFAAERYDKNHEAYDPYSETDICWDADAGRWILPTEQIIKEITEGRLGNCEQDYLAWLFHRKLADQIITACIKIREKTSLKTAALSGGCFQNRLLLRYVKEGLEKEGMRVLIHHLVPPNDGGIALGQAVAARQAVEDRRIRV